MSDPSDEQLVRAFQSGDEAAFSRFVTRHQDRVHRVALMWLRDASLADDAVQEAFLRTYAGISRFRFRAKPTTWLLRICRNVCFELNRKRVWVALEEDMLPIVDQPEPEDPGELIKLREAVAGLPERQRQVVTLRIFEELSTRETASVMGCREGTVKAHLNKAMNGLRSRLEGFET